MTDRGAGAGVPRIWLLPMVLLGGLIFATAVGVLSRSIVLDFIAWWPVWLALVILILVARSKRFRRLRVSKLVPLVVAASLIVFVVGHFLAWQAMPSSVPSLIGPVAGSESAAALSARAGGEITITQGPDFLYMVDPIRRGGDVGVPTATEQIQGSSISVVLEQPPDPGLYAFAGWDITVSPDPSWNLTLDGELDADLTALNLSGLQAFGSGTVALGNPSGTVPVTISGSFEVSVDIAVPVRIVGDADVPADWETLSDGSRAPVEGDGWVISVPDGSSVSVTRR